MAERTFDGPGHSSHTALPQHHHLVGFPCPTFCPPLTLGLSTWPWSNRHVSFPELARLCLPPSVPSLQRLSPFSSHISAYHSHLAYESWACQSPSQNSPGSHWAQVIPAPITLCLGMCLSSFHLLCDKLLWRNQSTSIFDPSAPRIHCLLVFGRWGSYTW